MRYYPRIRLQRLKNTTKFHKLPGFLPIFGPGTFSVPVSNFTVFAYCFGRSCIKMHSRHSCQKAYNTSQHIATHRNTSQNITTHRNTSQHITTHRNTSQRSLTLHFRAETRAGRNALLTNNRKRTEDSTAAYRQLQLKMFIMYT